jgi:hypothetical protein
MKKIPKTDILWLPYSSIFEKIWKANGPPIWKDSIKRRIIPYLARHIHHPNDGPGLFGFCQPWPMQQGWDVVTLRL